MPRSGVRLHVLFLISALFAVSGPSFLFAQAPAGGLTKEQLRTRILDLCVISESRKAGPTVPVVPKCGCYAKGMAQVMSGADAAYFVDKRTFPPAIRDRAVEIYGKCA
jgi:hypothetical protein